MPHTSTYSNSGSFSTVIFIFSQKHSNIWIVFPPDWTQKHHSIPEKCRCSTDVMQGEANDANRLQCELWPQEALQQTQCPYKQELEEVDKPRWTSRAPRTVLRWQHQKPQTSPKRSRTGCSNVFCTLPCGCGDGEIKHKGIYDIWVIEQCLRMYCI